MENPFLTKGGNSKKYPATLTYTPGPPITVVAPPSHLKIKKITNIVRAEQIVQRIVRDYWHANTVMTEFDVDGGRADVVVISRAGYLTEYEVKVSLSDLKADLKKEKFGRDRPSVTRFFYVVPHYLIPRLPSTLLAGAGVLEYTEGGWLVERRPAARRKPARKVPHLVARAHEAAYYRYWGRTLST